MTQHPGDDETRVLPLSPSTPPRADDDDDATVFKPLHTQAGDGAASSAATTASASQGTGDTWRRMSGMAEGERIAVGSLLKGRFLMERELGRGGMGVVYLARDERKVEARDRDPYVAIKVLNDEFRKHPDALIALQRESRRAQHLGNDHIVRVYDFDKDGSNVFMTMEYVEGDDLRTVIRSRARDGMPFDQAWPLIDGMGEALSRAHAAGIVHSDFKPGNVMVTPSGVAKVFDFGIARAGQIGLEAVDDRTVFDAGTLGAMTPAYASLEMLQGRSPTPGDDVYAFACVVVELLTGRHPFDKESAEEAMNAGRRPPAVPGLDKRQYKALCDGLAFTAEKRTRDIGDLLAGLRKRRWRERATPWLAGAVLLTVLAVGFAWYGAMRIHQQHVVDTLRRFGPGQADGFRNEDDARVALAALDGDERRRVVVDGADAIDGFLVRLVANDWDPAHGRYDYAGAQEAFRLRGELKTFAPRLDRRREEVAHERDEALNRLDTSLSQAMLANRLTGTSDDAVPAILSRIRAIDPASPLLSSPELKLKLAAVAPASTAAPPPTSPDIRAAEQASRLESLRRASAAGDLDKASDSFRQLRATQDGTGNVKDEAADLLAHAYLGAARAACAAGHWKEAADRIVAGVTQLPGRTDLAAANNRYQLALAVMTAARASTVTAADQDGLRKRVEAVGKDDPEGLKDLEAAMAASKALPDGSLANVVKKLRTVAPVADPCALRGLAGSGRECFDTFSAGAHGPAMVVVPRGRKPFAMMRTEVHIADLDQFCRATRTCAIKKDNPLTDPARSIDAAFARRYAAWLSQVSGHVYRLPSEDEWLLAARAGENWDAKEANCGASSSGLGRLMRSDELTSKGIVNPWGLIDMTGSVWEWATRGDALVVHGGSFRSGPAVCSVASVRPSNGSPERDVGFRLVRDIK
ncbi:bifunctional serine/threonine-protein kinase/formylglycine-generating enzyme family protein [Luteibacter sp. 22Crub2.1]|uniref:bifunctional serine/threonine-protein kinase/formylglycine-generating enzyme family protein n=1 Tax=Luteibacter sp. 22Crub2.1 TaxID=1283288 RepID=UPI0009A7B6AD|nr:bifunctional serine/threonine-protein kinase/formylglycine-generating enzyme family protein [Luteibacter sp. 22Crub2.1]SKB43212.1 Serine/threonine protein kinase [Luteibacter sp. 22Crub2.1]